jgi:hypothetical protein
MALSADGVVEDVSLLMGRDDAIHASRMGSERYAATMTYSRPCSLRVGVTRTSTS